MLLLIYTRVDGIQRAQSVLAVIILCLYVTCTYNSVVRIVKLFTNLVSILSRISVIEFQR